MFNRVINAVKRAGNGSAFDAYFGSVYGKGLSGVPTHDEAKRDYREAMRQRNSGY